MHKLKTPFLFFAFLFLTFSLYAQESDVRHIKVLGTGQVNVVPDEILFSYTINIYELEVQDARRKNRDLAVKSIAFLKSLNIPERHIQTKYMSIHPTKESHRSNKIINYLASQTIHVCVKDLNSYEQIVDELLALGITSINNPIFRTTELKDKQAEATILALKDAEKKIDEMLSILGAKRGPVFQVKDITSQGRNRNNNAYQNTTVEDQPGGSAGIAVGEMGIVAKVEVSYYIL